MNDINFSAILNDITKPLYEKVEPDVYPPSIRDVDMLPGNKEFDLHLPMSGACPRCGAHGLIVGDYVYFGVCNGCIYDAMEKGEIG